MKVITTTYNSAKLTTLIIVVTLGLIYGCRSGEKMTREQAVKLAQQFVIGNGYTNLPADKSKLSFELLDRHESNVDSILRNRYNTLQPKAFCILEGKDRWDVGFLSTDVDLSKLDSMQLRTNLSGRAVIVMKDGKEIKIAHKDPLFSYFIKL